MITSPYAPYYDVLVAHCSNGSGYFYDGLWGKPHNYWCAPLEPICTFMFSPYEMFVTEKKWLGKHLLFLVLMQAGGSLRWSHEWCSDPLSSCLMTTCSHYMLLPCVANGYTFIGSTTWRVLEVLGQPIASIILPIVHVLNCRRHHGKTMISTLQLFSSCGKNHLENLRGHLMAKFLDGEAWAILGGHTISSQEWIQPHMYHKWREKHLQNQKPNSPFSSNTLHKPGVEIFIWMIAWMRGSSLWKKISHAFHHSYIEEAIA